MEDAFGLTLITTLGSPFLDFWCCILFFTQGICPNALFYHEEKSWAHNFCVFWFTFGLDVPELLVKLRLHYYMSFLSCISLLLFSPFLYFSNFAGGFL